jgi:ribosome biogenesis SPOUT family RNA methylase Rps3
MHSFIVEHLDPELEDWQGLEYNCIHKECDAAGSKFLLSGLTATFEDAAKDILKVPASSKTSQSVENLYPTQEQRQRVCLLDPRGEKDLSPEDGEQFDAFLFGGILGTFLAFTTQEVRGAQGHHRRRSTTRSHR